MILEFVVELLKARFAQTGSRLTQERTERALRERMLRGLLVEQRAEFHVDIGQLRESVVIAIERGSAEREEAFFAFAQEHAASSGESCAA